MLYGDGDTKEVVCGGTLMSCTGMGNATTDNAAVEICIWSEESSRMDGDTWEGNAPTSMSWEHGACARRWERYCEAERLLPVHLAVRRLAWCSDVLALQPMSLKVTALCRYSLPAQAECADGVMVGANCAWRKIVKVRR